MLSASVDLLRAKVGASRSGKEKLPSEGSCRVAKQAKSRSATFDQHTAAWWASLTFPSLSLLSWEAEQLLPAEQTLLCSLWWSVARSKADAHDDLLIVQSTILPLSRYFLCSAVIVCWLFIYLLSLCFPSTVFYLCRPSRLLTSFTVLLSHWSVCVRHCDDDVIFWRCVIQDYFVCFCFQKEC